MRRTIALVLSLTLLFGTLASCAGKMTSVDETGTISQSPGSSTEEPPTADPGTEPSSEDEPETKYPTEYVPPEDGSFTVCGTDLSEYHGLLYFPFPPDNNSTQMNQHPMLNRITAASEAAGFSLKIDTVRNEKHNETPKYEHEILFGHSFERPGIPSVPKDVNAYRVTADGTIWFSSPSPLLYDHLFSLFLEEFFGVPYGSGTASGGCALTECYRELPRLTDEELRKMGYEIVFEDDFDGDSLNLDVWEHVGVGQRRLGYSSAETVRVEDGKLKIVGSYREEGEFGAAWYAGMVGLKQWYCRGYFEASILCSEEYHRGGDFWTAFWIQGPAPYQADLSQGGAEIDILENFGPDFTSCTIWCTGAEGKGDELVKDAYEIYGIGNRYDEEYHTYSVLWDESYYRFYLDGTLIAQTDFANGTSSVEEQVLLSLEPCGSYAKEVLERGITEMATDWIRIWQKKEP